MKTPMRPDTSEHEIGIQSHGRQPEKSIFSELTGLREVAEQAALRAGEIQRDHQGGKSLAVLENRSRDLKIAVDRLCESAVCDLIRAAYPDHAILSEESGLEVKDSHYLWIVDPLDGTLNYYFGLPLFCVCVACYRFTEKIGRLQRTEGIPHFSQAEQLVGVVHAPRMHRMFSAATGRGACCNGQPMAPPASIRLQDAMVGISFGSDDAVIEKMEAVNAVLVRRVKKVRILGSTGLDLAHVAMGHLSALIQLKIQMWDIAAALVILNETGVRYDVRPGLFGGWQLIAAVPSIFQSIRDIVRQTVACQ